MSACRRGGSIFILKTAFKNINQAQQNVNLGFSLNCCEVYFKKSLTWLQTPERSKVTQWTYSPSPPTTFTTRTYASCPVCSIHDTRTMAPEDSGVGDAAQPATELKQTLAAMSTFELRDIDASIIATIDRWRATHRTTSCHHVTRKTYPGAHRYFIFHISC